MRRKDVKSKFEMLQSKIDRQNMYENKCEYFYYITLHYKNVWENY